MDQSSDHESVAAPLSATRPGARPLQRMPAEIRLFLGMILGITLLTALALLHFRKTGHAFVAAQITSIPTDEFGDFFHYRALFSKFHTEAFFTNAERFAYPAPCAVLYAVLYHTGPRPHGVYDILLLSIYLISGFVLYRVLLRLGLRRRDGVAVTAVLMLTSYPWHTLYDRGNIELFVYVFIAGGVWAYLTGRPMLAAVLWGCAGAMKIYPIAMLAVFLHRKTLRPLAIGIATFAAVLLASFWYVGPTIRIAAMGSLNGVFGFLGRYAASARKDELNLDHSILGAIKEMLTMHRLALGTDWPNLSKGYQAVVIVCGPILFFGWIRRLPALNQLCLMLVAVVLLPPVSYDYTLIHTYLILGIVFGAYFYALRTGTSFPAAKAFFACFAILTTTQTWIQIQSLRLNGVIKCITLLVLCVLLLRFPLRMGLEAESLENA